MKTECPHCGQRYELDDTLRDQIVECSNCKEEFVAEEAVCISHRPPAVASFGNPPPRVSPRRRYALAIGVVMVVVVVVVSGSAYYTSRQKNQAAYERASNLHEQAKSQLENLKQKESAETKIAASALDAFRIAMKINSTSEDLGYSERLLLERALNATRLNWRELGIKLEPSGKLSYRSAAEFEKQLKIKLLNEQSVRMEQLAKAQKSILSTYIELAKCANSADVTAAELSEYRKNRAIAEDLLAKMEKSDQEIEKIRADGI